MEIKLYSRLKTKAGDLVPSDTFRKIGNSQVVYMVIDLTKVDGFSSPVSLREDVIYCSNLETGELEIVQKAIEVERLIVKCTEVLVLI